MKPLLLPLLLLLAAAPPCPGSSARLQRRAPDEAASARNDVGEITYSLDGDAAVLRIGTSDRGTLPVADPAALHLAPRRLLLPGEYSIRVDGPCRSLPDGSLLLATNLLAGVQTNLVLLRPVDPALKLASVAWDLASGGNLAAAADALSEDAATLSVHTSPDAGWSLLRVADVWAWTTPRRPETLDTEATPLPYRDPLGETTLRDLRPWAAGRVASSTNALRQSLDASTNSLWQSLHGGTNSLWQSLATATNALWRGVSAELEPLPRYTDDNGLTATSFNVPWGFYGHIAFDGETLRFRHPGIHGTSGTDATLRFPVADATLATDEGVSSSIAAATNALADALAAPLAGQVHDLSDMRGLFAAVSNCVAALGGAVTNYPAFQQP